ncbi:hypothetical protein EDC38_2176 [Marinimicrobium koreense]|uniref:Uncharacterized protein n=1 Tax=Marinimicrobium koreense TaxID=306545 RepID=A0A3N1NRS7_9GAMM|nr:hypothetical protein [Marinimicrobium koreense]ROQ21552.1 hypothetical protein EDC38_2176 [Marinimicrobium koreense]
MENADQVKGNVRLLVFIVTLPFWALLAIEVYSIWLGDPYTFDITHALVAAAIYAFFRIVVQGKNPMGTTDNAKQ